MSISCPLGFILLHHFKAHSGEFHCEEALINSCVLIYNFSSVFIDRILNIMVVIVQDISGILQPPGRVHGADEETVPLDLFVRRTWHFSDGWTKLDLGDGRYILDMAQVIHHEHSMSIVVTNICQIVISDYLLNVWSYSWQFVACKRIHIGVCNLELKLCKENLGIASKPRG